MGTTCIFSSGRDPHPPGSKNGNLAYSHAGLPACPAETPTEAREGRLDQDLGGNGGVAHPPVCVHCGSSEPTPNQVAVDELNIWLHRGCEAEYLGNEDDGLGTPAFQRRRAS